MKVRSRWLCFLALTLLVVATSCSRDPNVLKRKYVENGDKYFRAGKYREASIMYRSAIRKDPRYAEAYSRQAITLIKLGRYGDAGRALRRALELLPEGPDRVRARVELANICLSYLEVVGMEKFVWSEAENLANELLHLDPRSYEGFRIRGRLASLSAADFAKKLPAEAVESLGKAVSDLQMANSIRPFQPEVITSLGRSLWAAGQPEAAEKLLTAAIEHDKTFLPAYSELNRLYSRNNRIADAEKVLKLAIQNNPNEHGFEVDLAIHYRMLGRRDEMTQVLERLKTQSAEVPSAYEVAGDLYLQMGDMRSAIRQYEQGIAAFPKDQLKYQKLIVDALASHNQQAEAEKINDSILKNKPTDLDALVRRAQFLFEKGDLSNSTAELETLLRKSPNHPIARYTLGRALLAGGRSEDARFQFSEAVRWAPKFLPPRIALAQIQLGTGEFGKAVATADDILVVDNNNAKAKLIRGVGLKELGKLEEARAEFQALLRIHPKYDEALIQMGSLYVAEHKWKEARAFFRKGYEANTANLTGLMVIVNFHLARNEPDLAVRFVQAETKKYPDRTDLRTALADVETRAGRPALAIPEYQRLLKELEKDPRAVGDIHLRMSEAYRRSGDLTTAISHLKQAHQLLPKSSMVLHNLGILHDLVGQKIQAKEYYEASLKIDGENGIALNNLAYYMAENGGDLDQALTFAQRARQKLPHQLGVADTLGVIYLKKNLVENALEILEDLVSKKPDEAVFRMHLGEALLKKGETAKAKKELQVALASKPSSEDTAKIKDLLAKTGT
jgi:tetratricopeptide (TPR) repeat protein